jgi:hypothetical protein
MPTEGEAVAKQPVDGQPEVGEHHVRRHHHGHG